MPEGIPHWRVQVLRRFGSEAFDVAVIGGGITGAGVARDAVLRGQRVALLEAGDFASGTSSRSSRLVHGGVRYLEHGHLHLVFEASRERRALLRIAPHLVRPLAFTWPVYDGARVSRLRLSLGLGLYDALSLFRNVAHHERLTRSQVLAREPGLDPAGLEGGARYFDAATDDVRLTLANVTAAADAGAAILNHAPATRLVIAGGRACGVEAVDAVTGSSFVVRASTIVNATGPWSDTIRALESPLDGPAITGSRGAHVAVARRRVGNRDAVTLLHPRDGRVLFALPAGDQAIIGTTETRTRADDPEPRASPDEIRYLLDAANRYFPDARLTPEDVIAAWAGIRPLAAQVAGADVGSASREHAIQRGAHGVVHVTGGKLTTYRAMAEQVVDAFAGHGGGRGATSVVPLPGGEVAPAELEPAAAAAIADAGVRERLLGAHGTRWSAVWSLADTPVRRDRLDPRFPVIGAEVAWAVAREMAQTLGDVLIRRTRLAFQAPDQARSIAPAAAALMAPLLHWTPADRDAALRDYDDEVRRTFG